nr:hypothetical protein [Rhodoferax ferrireducens]
MPGEPHPDLVQVGVKLLHHGFADGAPETVGFPGLHLHLLSEHQAGEVLFGTLSERLRFFRGVDAA